MRKIKTKSENLKIIADSIRIESAISLKEAMLFFLLWEVGTGIEFCASFSWANSFVFVTLCRGIPLHFRSP
jgi:hypothetical protein